MSGAADSDVIAKYAYPEGFRTDRKWTEKAQTLYIKEVDAKLIKIARGRIVDRFDDAGRAYRCLVQA